MAFVEHLDVRVASPAAPPGPWLIAVAGAVADVQDPAPRVRGLLPVGQRAVRLAVELHAGLLDQQLVHQGRALLGQDARRLGQRGACAGLEDVLHQQVGAVVRARDGRCRPAPRTCSNSWRSLALLSRMMRRFGSRARRSAVADAGDAGADDEYVSGLHASADLDHAVHGPEGLQADLLRHLDHVLHVLERRRASLPS